MLGYVLHRQPTVILRVFVANAWICAPQATDRDPQSLNVNAWTCARRATDRDPESFV